MANFAFIDSQNVHLGIRDQGWRLDWARFRQCLRDKYAIETAFAFIGYVPGNESLYTHLQRSGFIMVHKPTLKVRKSNKVIVKGNVDAELVLHTMIEWNNYEKAVIVSGDGDFRCLIEHLLRQDKLERLLIPNQRNFSSLLRVFGQHVTFMNLLKQHIEIQKMRGIAAGQNPLVDPSS